MRAIALVVVLAARVASAEPDPGSGSGSARPAVVSELPPPSAATSPVTQVEATTAPRKRFGKGWAAASVAGVYGAFGTWAYFAWFHNAHTMPFSFDTAWKDENPFALHTYAGGADKVGHLWANYVLVRGTTELLVAGGWDRVPSSFVAAGLAEAAFTASEIKDGFIWGFEVGDVVGNMLGAALAVAMEDIPALDRLFDFRLAYFPSADMTTLIKNKFLSRGDGLDIAQDYTGQSYMLALHLSALPRVDDSPWLRWGEYVDVVGGFETRFYSPTPVPRVYPPHQAFYAGVTVNMQQVLSALLPDSRGRRIGRGAFEVFTLPFTTLRFAEAIRTWDMPPAQPPPE